MYNRSNKLSVKAESNNALYIFFFSVIYLWHGILIVSDSFREKLSLEIYSVLQHTHFGSFVSFLCHQFAIKCELNLWYLNDTSFLSTSFFFEYETYWHVLKLFSFFESINFSLDIVFIIVFLLLLLSETHCMYLPKLSRKNWNLLIHKRSCQKDSSLLALNRFPFHPTKVAFFCIFFILRTHVL